MNCAHVTKRYLGALVAVKVLIYPVHYIPSNSNLLFGSSVCAWEHITG